MEVWVILYKDELHNQTGPDWIVDRVFDSYGKVLSYESIYTPEYWTIHFKVVKSHLY